MDVVKRLQIAQLKNSSEHLPAEMMALDQFSKKKKKMNLFVSSILYFSSPMRFENHQSLSKGYGCS